MRGLSPGRHVPDADHPGQHLQRRRWLIGGAALAAWPTIAPLHALAASAGPQRIVSVGGAITETLFALGAAADLVGADTTSLHPTAAQQLPSVGYARALSAEGVLSLRPTLVLATADAGPPAVLRQLEAAGLAMAVLDAEHSIDGVVGRTRRVAALCGRGDTGRALVAALQRDWAATAARVARFNDAATQAGRSRPRVLFVLSHSMAQVRVAGRNTAADAMLTLAGASNVMAGIDGYKPLSPEAAIAAAPDVILATEQGLAAAGGIDGLLSAPGLAQTPAGRQRRVVALDALLLLGFGPRLPQAVALLADGVHGKPA